MTENENNHNSFDPKKGRSNYMATLLTGNYIGDSGEYLEERAKGLVEDVERNVEFNIPKEHRDELIYIVSIRWLYRPRA